MKKTPLVLGLALFAIVGLNKPAQADTCTYAAFNSAGSLYQSTFLCGSGGGAALTLVAGPGISLTGTSTAPQVNNLGVLSLTPGTGVTISGTPQNPIVNASGGSSLPSAAIVQSAFGKFNGAFSIPLTSAPVVGDVLIYIAGGFSNQPIVVPAFGWQVYGSTASNQGFYFGTRVVKSGDPASVAISNITDQHSVAIYEISNFHRADVSGVALGNLNFSPTVYYGSSCSAQLQALCFGLAETDGINTATITPATFVIDFQSAVANHPVVHIRRSSPLSIGSYDQPTYSWGSATQNTISLSVTVT